MGDVGQFLSPEWLRELGEAAAAGAAVRAVAGDVNLAVHHEVTGGPTGDVEYEVRIAGGTVVVDPAGGPATGAAAADLDVRMAYETAVAINRGQLAPSQAFAAGQVRVGGRPGAVARHREALARLDEVFAGPLRELRARTTY